MGKSTHLSGMQGVFLVAAKLAEHGFIVSPTSRSAAGADLLITDLKCQRAYSVQVKTNTGNPNFWLLSANAHELKSDTHIYVFVNLNKGKPFFFVVPSRVVAETMQVDNRNPGSVWYSWKRDMQYLDRWNIFGDSQ